MATDQALFDKLRSQFSDEIVRIEFTTPDSWIEVRAAALVNVCRVLRDDPALRYDMLSCVSGVDYLQTDPKKAAKLTWQPHVEVVYHLFSTLTKQTCVLKVFTRRWKDDCVGQLPEVPSVCATWPGANWHEREVYDLMGIHFVGHPDLRRILCPEDWIGHPLRKDYQPPESYHGIRDH